MPSVKEIYKYLDKKFPYCMQEDYDNSGIMVDCGRDISKVVISLDVTNSVVDYAASVGAELILSHHPVIFRPIKSISHDSPVYRLIANEISAISAHTNYDIADGGVNDELASKLDLHDVRPVFKVSQCNIEDVMCENYIGRMGNLSRDQRPDEFAELVIKSLGIPQAEYTDGGKNIRTVAVGGGACGEFVFECKRYGIDAFVTGEAKHHEMVYAAENGITMVIGGHYATESIALAKLADTLKAGFENLSVEVVKIDNPVSYTGK